MSGSLQTLADYEKCVREACPRVRHVTVDGPGTNSRIPQGTVRVRVSRSWWRRLSRDDLQTVRVALVERKPIMVMLELESP